ncbi:glutathione S-transferase family protein [Gayadomonas joobiniege]|uniref:glutathione S-transferase family protein n=1 Tax=Gayadomonas joobiniege TaxID=1234606 RepID=UPI00037482BC|nr:glutathione S-transferase N-terminal domain-containing protein [Gayadomonas joobiniege]
MTNNEPVTLYAYVTSPYAMKVHSFLLYKQIPFQVYYVNPTHPERELPFGRSIPVLKIGQKARNDSTPIGLWLDQCISERPLMPAQVAVKNRVLTIDQWVSEHLIPSIFFSVYPKFFQPSSLRQCWPAAMQLGRCVAQTTHHGFPAGLRYLWPLLLNRAAFIRRLIEPLAAKKTASEHRKSVLLTLENKLQSKSFLADTEHPTLADLSAWSQIVGPYQLNLYHMDDFLNFSNIRLWVKRVAAYLPADTNKPPLVPAILNPRELHF